MCVRAREPTLQSLLRAVLRPARNRPEATPMNRWIADLNIIQRTTDLLRASADERIARGAAQTPRGASNSIVGRVVGRIVGHLRARRGPAPARHPAQTVALADVPQASAVQPVAPEAPVPAARGVAEWDTVITMAYATHAVGLRQRFQRATFDDGLAEDLLQEAFARLCVQVQNGRTPDNIGGWLHRVGMNVLASEARRDRTARRNAERVRAPRGAESPEDSAEHRDLSRRLSIALAALEPADRTAILLAARGTSRAEMAVHLGRSEEATRALLCRARSKLRVSLCG